MKIAVCDDEQVFVDKTINFLNSLVADTDTCDIFPCSSGEELLNKHNSERFDIILLDIEMNGISGMDTAREIRRNDKKVIIAFLTNYQEFAVEGYEVNAYRYIVKNQPEYIYEKQFKSIFEEYSQNHKYFEIPSKGVVAHIFLRDICFFEIFNKEVTVHTMTGKHEYFGKLSDVEKQLKNDLLFTKSHKSYIINIAQVESINKSEIIMKNGKKALLSRNYRKKVVDSYISYMTER